MNDTDILKRFGKRIRALRIQKGITSQMQLALDSGLDRTYIGGIERGDRNVALKNIERIGEALGVGMQELFDF
jgi:transcriptional regulator with XRE-family HTH domain